ncbi:hypothetical protein Aglo02_05100 [Actinokineospora globicatena]|nr:hypothetical protein Aglo02_05100 [Actinokineospora globicatena]
MFDDQRGLDQARDPGRALQVPEVRLGRPHGQRRGPCDAECRPQGGRLDRVAHRRAGAVEFDIADVVGVDIHVRGPEHVFLGVAARCRQAGTATVVVYGTPQDHRVDPVAVS